LQLLSIGISHPGRGRYFAWRPANDVYRAHSIFRPSGIAHRSEDLLHIPVPEARGEVA
jgi:hypothetical protein